jgi:hypothetical protein
LILRRNPPSQLQMPAMKSSIAVLSPRLDFWEAHRCEWRWAFSLESSILSLFTAVQTGVEGVKISDTRTADLELRDNQSYSTYVSSTQTLVAAPSITVTGSLTFAFLVSDRFFPHETNPFH